MLLYWASGHIAFDLILYKDCLCHLIPDWHTEVASTVYSETNLQKAPFKQHFFLLFIHLTAPGLSCGAWIFNLHCGAQNL